MLANRISRCLFGAIVLFITTAFASTVEIVVKDPSGAAIAGAALQITQQETAKEVRTDSQGRAHIALAPGEYQVSLNQAGFEPESLKIQVTDANSSLEIVLRILKQEEAVEVTGKRSSLANSDPNYVAIRQGTLKTSYRVQNLTIERDLGRITLVSGTIDFMPPVLGRVVTGVFTGEGVFRLDPMLPVDKTYLNGISGKPQIEEHFKSAVLNFTDSTYDEIQKAGTAIDEAPKGAGALKEFRGRMRHRTDEPRSLWEAMLGGENVVNVEAELLAELYDSGAPPVFTAYLHGDKHSDLRFLVKPRGALPMLPSPEEVAVINYDIDGTQEGVWFLSHLQSEWKQQSASNGEDKRTVAVEHYRIETAIGNNDHMSATCEMRLRPRVTGPRVVRFALLPALRVTRASIQGKDIPFVQEGRKEDGSFYVILPSPLEKDEVQQLTVEYEGNKVVKNAGGGTFFIGARTSWYPSANAFTEHSTFDLTFKVPKKYTMVSVGKLVKSWREDDFAATQWVSNVPLAVAGFNYGLFKEKNVTDSDTKYVIETFASREAPDYLRGAGFENMAPSALAERAMIDAQNSIRLFYQFYGELPYGRIAITQQPDFNFGQSWPSLVYLPVSAFLDSTQRWALMGGNAFRFANFIEEVTPHEVSHQWWGHLVGWASYHDQWLSEGFADFSAGLYLQFIEQKPDKVLKYWEDARKSILEKNEFGMAANDAGPVWLGLRLDTHRTSRAYNNVVYRKGGFVLHMLRQLMWTPKEGDKAFIAMMHDFVKTYQNQNATTESFKTIAEKYMTPEMDLEGNHRLDWFFREWVLGTEIPKYRLDYSLTAESDGSTLLKGKMTQSGVSDHFMMRVPLYLDLDGKLIRLGSISAEGPGTSKEFQVKLPKKPKRVLLNAMHDVLASEVIMQQN